MDKIYGIFRGEYSGWEVLGYCSTREEAEKQCAIHNNASGYGYYEYVKELNCLDGKIETTKTDLYYLHEVIFYRNKNNWVMRDEPINYEYSVKEMEQRETRSFRDCIYVYVKSRKGEKGRKRVEKIAQDKLYKYLAEQSGLI